MTVGENEIESTGDVFLDIVNESRQEAASNESAPVAETTEPVQEVTGETPTTDNPETTETEGTETETPVQESEVEQPAAQGEFDQNKWIGEMSGGLFDSVESFQEADVFSKIKEFDQLQDQIREYEEAPEPELEYASAFTQELDEYVKNGGDAKTFFEIVSANYDEVSDIELVKRDLMSKQGLTSDEAAKFINYRYKLDKEEFTEGESEMGGLNMKMDANKLRDEYKAIQETARVPQARQEIDNFEQLEDDRMNEWENPINETVSKLEDPVFPLGKELGDFKYQLNDDDRESVNEFVYNAIEGFGLDVNTSDPNLVQTMANNHIWATKGPEIIKSALADQYSKLEEKYFKDRHNPSPIPATETPGGEKEVSRDENIFNTIMGAEGRM
ncbi:MAG: hypothetical protein ACXADH_14840 [Candidatus Kariarchaeaceae archaeon]|jgi:hypothetical protein